ncbi:MAG: hypothetical protein ACRCSU_07345 [Paracoccaceae bacterium]
MTVLQQRIGLDKMLRDRAKEKAFATVKQGILAETALQPSDVGTAAAADATDFATAAQGLLADSAMQPGDPLVLENRTDDPASPEVGQMWIRTDL